MNGAIENYVGRARWLGESSGTAVFRPFGARAAAAGISVP